MNHGNQLSTNQLTVVAGHSSNFKQHHYKYVGTFASDEALTFLHKYKKIINNTTTPWGMIVNVDPIQEAGSHWMAIYSIEGGSYLFDSYGGSGFLDRYPHLKPLLDFVQVLETPQLQSNTSYVCGHYSLAFLYYVTHNRSLASFIKSFPGPYSVNDKSVCRFVCDVMIPHNLRGKFEKEYIKY